MKDKSWDRKHLLNCIKLIKDLSCYAHIIYLHNKLLSIVLVLWYYPNLLY